MPRRNKRTPPATPFSMRETAACTRKRRFRNEKEALDAAELQMLAQPSLELSVYQCGVCGGWHLTRTPRTS